MEQPSLVMKNNNSKNVTSSEANSVSQQKMKKIKNSPKIPTAEELISHYESQGMETKQASIKVINDLQKALFRIVTSTNKQQNQQQQQHKEMNGALLKRVDMKLDSKPGFPQMLGIGVASAAVFRGIETFFAPQVFASFANIWNSVRSATNSNPTDKKV